MNLIRVELSHLGPFKQPVVLEGLELRGLHVLADDNETGKSTLIRAVIRGLFDKAKSLDQEIKSLQPVGTSLGPRVVVDLEAGGGRYRVEKQFLKNKTSRLSRWEADGWRLIAEEDEAEKQLLALLQAGAPGRGASKEAHWGMLAHLWSRQGEPTRWLDMEGEAGEQLRAHFTSVTLDPVLDRMTDRLNTIADQSLTASGLVKKNGLAKVAELERDKAAEQLDDVDAKLRSLSADVSRRKELESKLARLTDELTKREECHGELKEKSDAVEGDQKLVERLRSDLESQKSALGKLVAAEEKHAQAANDLASLDAEHEKITTTLSAGGEEASELDSKLQAAQDGRKFAHEALKLAQASHQRTGELIRLRQTQAEARTARETLAQLEDSETALRKLRHDLDALPEITEESLRQMDDWRTEITQLEASIAAAGLTVTLEPTQTGPVGFDDGEKTAEISVEGGQAHPLHSPDRMEIHLPEWGRIKVESGAGEARELAERLAKARGKLSEQLGAFQCADLAAARKLLGQRRSMTTEMKTAREELVRTLNDDESLDDLRSRATRLEQDAKTQIGKLRPNPEESEASLNDLHSLQGTQSTDVDSAQTNLDSAEAAEQTAKKKMEHHQKGAEAQNKRLHKIEVEQARHQETVKIVGQQYPDGLETAKAAAGGVVIVAEEKLKRAEIKLPENLGQLESDLNRAATALKEAQAEMKTCREEFDRLKGAIQVRGGEGLYSRQGILTENHARHEETAQRELTKARAACLVASLLTHHKREAIADITGPLEAELSRSFAAITGRDDRQVFLNEQLGITGIGADRDRQLPFELLSQGAKEQLLLCLRGAVALKLAEAEPQVLILDDALVNTDGVRQDRVLSYLEELGHDLQVIVLTCHGDRYRGVGIPLKIRLMENAIS